MNDKLTGRGGANRGQGRKPLSPTGHPYRQYPLKLPPEVIEWLEKNVGNKNGFIVEAIKAAIQRCSGNCQGEIK